MKYIDQAIERIDRGRKGLNLGLPMGFNRLVEYLPNIQQATYYLLGGGPKVGKSSMADDMFLYNPYDYIINNKQTDFELDIDYFSFEVEKITKIVKGICRRLHYKYGITTDVNFVLSKGKNRISDDVYRAVVECKDYFERLEDILHIHDTPINPTGINKYLYGKVERHGKVIRKPVEVKEDNGSVRTIEVFDRYVPYNEKRYHLVIVDHVALMHTESNYAVKQNIDKISQYFVALRNNYFITPIVIQQLSFDSESSDRARVKKVTPTLYDFGDSKYTTRDANVIMALFNPSAFGMETFNNYNIKLMGNRFRNLEILANRDGEPNVNIGLHFEGKVGTFKEMPLATELKTVLDYEKILRS